MGSAVCFPNNRLGALEAAKSARLTWVHSDLWFVKVILVVLFVGSVDVL